MTSRDPESSRFVTRSSLAVALFLVLAALLVARALPRMGMPKSEAYQASMKSDLHVLVSVQEAYWAEHGQFASDLRALDTYFYDTSRDVTVQVLAASEEGWSAAAAHSGLETPCIVYVGDDVRGTMLVPGEPWCVLTSEDFHNPRPGPYTFVLTAIAGALLALIVFPPRSVRG